MMRRALGLVLGVLLLAGLAGCNGGGSGSGSTFASSSFVSSSSFEEPSSTFVSSVITTTPTDEGDTLTTGDGESVARVHNPEPASMLLWGIGLAGAAAMRRRKMGKKGLVGIILLGLLFMVPSAQAAFVNGGFEDGSFTGWTKNGGRYNWGGSYSYTGDPGKSAIVSAGLDPFTNNNLSTVYSGNYSARVNNSDNGYHFSTIEQTVTWNDPSIYFAWAAVIQDPGHAYAGHMRITLDDITDSVNLYNIYFDYNNASSVLGATNWHLYNGWGYTDWNTVQLDTSNSIGHDLRLSLLASDCGAGGHGGYAYLDGFGASAPIQGPENVVPEPASMLLWGIGAAGMAFMKKRGRK